jgi:hypothetical protein
MERPPIIMCRSLFKTFGYSVDTDVGDFGDGFDFLPDDALNWSFDAFRTNNTNDIQFVATTSGLFHQCRQYAAARC